MASVLILHASQEGHTEKVADFIGTILEDEGHEVTVAPLELPPALARFGAVVVGASVHVGRYPDTLARYVGAHLDTLETMPSAFFSVCLTAAAVDEAQARGAQTYIDSLLSETGWHPAATLNVAGALRFSEYGFFKRQLMRALAEREGLETDGKHDTDFTDWDDLTLFAQRVSSLIKKARVTG